MGRINVGGGKKPVGTAVVGDVLSGKTFTTPLGHGLTGTIPSKGAATITPGTTNQTIAAGQYLSGIQTIAGDADLIPSNIVNGKNIFNVAGNNIDIIFTPGDNIQDEYVNEASTTSLSYVRIHRWTLGSQTSGTIRVKFTLRSNGTNYAYARIYKNGEAYGTERVTTSGSGVVFSQDLTFNASDEISIWHRGTSGATAYTSNLQFCTSVPSILTSIHG